MAAGWIKLYRQLRDHELWTAERFTRGQAWADMLMFANFEPNTIRIRGIDVHLDRGDLAWSRLHLAERWKWNRRTVDKYLKELSTRKMIHTKTSNLTTVISILNFDSYQNSAQQNTQENTQQSAHREEVKEFKKDLKKNVKMGQRHGTALPCSFGSWLLTDEGKDAEPEIVKIIKIFLEQYEYYRGEKHPNLKPGQWIKNHDALYSHEIVGESLNVECAKEMIRNYFETNFPNVDVDYHLDHFCTEGILMNRFFEECY